MYRVEDEFLIHSKPWNQNVRFACFTTLHLMAAQMTSVAVNIN